MRTSSPRLSLLAFACLGALTSLPATAQQVSTATDTEAVESIVVTGNWLGSDTTPSVRTFPGARTLLTREQFQSIGALNLGDALKRLPGLQATENSSSSGSAIALNIGVRGLTGRYSPRSTVLMDGIPLGVAPYGQPQLSFAPVSLNNVQSIDVIRGGGAVRYGPQNVGGIINFKTRAVPTTPGLTGDASVRYTDYNGSGEHTATYSAFLGTQLEGGLGLALLYSGLDGSTWRKDSDERYDDLSLKYRYALNDHSEVYGKFSYFDVRSSTPGGLTVAQFNADPFQNTRPTDFWDGGRRGADIGYLNTLSATQELELRLYYNESDRRSGLINAARTQYALQPRDYTVLGFEPRYTQRLKLAGMTHDITAGYRFLRERGDDKSFNVTIASGAVGATTTFSNATDAHSLYVDDKIAIGAWRITPGVRYEKINSTRIDRAGAGQTFESDTHKALPSLNVAYLLNVQATLFANYTTSYGVVQNTQLNSQSAANPLRPELAKTAELGGRWQGNALKAELTVFRINFDNQIQQIAGTNPPLFQNVGATRHSGLEAAVEYAFDKAGALAGLSAYANVAYTKATQESGSTAGLDLPFYARRVDTTGLRYALAAWTFNLSTTHQSRQFSDNANTVAETAAANNGVVPGFRLWNAQASWQPGLKGLDLVLGVNNIDDKRYYTRNVDANAGRMTGAPRTVYGQARYAF